MTMDDLNSFAYNDVAEDWEEGKDGRERSLAIYDKEGYIVNLQSICKVSNTCTAGVCVSDDYDFMSTINEFLGKVSDRLMDGGMRGNYCRQLIHVTLYTPYIP